MQALVECEGESIDLSGDMGAVGRIIVPDVRNGNHDMFLDLKGMHFAAVLNSGIVCLLYQLLFSFKTTLNSHLFVSNGTIR